MRAAELPPAVRALYPFEGRRLAIGGTTLHALDEGADRARPAVLLLHGNPTWSFAFRDLVLRLRPRFRCVAPDHAGCGLSDKPRDYPYHLARHVDNARAVLDALGVGRYVLIAHDWGGAIGVGLALREPERVAGLVLMNTAAFLGPAPLRIRLCRWRFLGDLAIRGLNLFSRGLLAMGTAKPLPPAVAAGYLAPYGDWAGRAGVMGFLRDIPLERSHPTRGLLERLERDLPLLRGKPALLAWGLRDFCFTPGYLGRWKRELPGAEVRAFPEAGHLVMEDAAAELGPLVEGFLARIT